MRLYAVLVLGTVLAAAAAACGGDDGGDVTPTATRAARTPAATATATPREAATPTRAASPTPAGSPGGREDGDAVERTLTLDGRERAYRLYVPPSVAGVPAPLVIAMHGGFGNAAQFARTTGFDAEAERGGFIMAYPEGTGEVQTWNGGACCGFAARENVDDVAFIAALIDDVAAAHPVDTGRVFAVGHSNGAIMALTLACELADRIAAVGAVAGSLEVDSCTPSQPVSVLMVHGDSDLNHPLEGGQGPYSVAGVDFRSVEATMETLRVANGCDPGPQVTRDIDVIVTIWPCPAGVRLEQRVIVGGTHAWPGSGQVLPSGPASQAMDATSALWSWLERR